MGANGSSEQAEAQQETTVEAEEELSLIDAILAETKIKPADEGYSVARQGVAAFISELLKPTREGVRVQSTVVDEMIAEVDRKISAQTDSVIHHEDFQKMESAWRGLKLVIDRTDFRENTIVEMMNVSKDDLLSDFEDSPEVVKSGLYKWIYSSEYGTLGGEPYGAMIANYNFGPGAQDIKLLQYVSSVGAMAHCPFIAAADPKFFGLEDFRRLPNLRDLSSIFDGPQYIKWNSFRETEDSRYVGLTMPRFLLRTPYDPEENPVQTFEYKERASRSIAGAPISSGREGVEQSGIYLCISMSPWARLLPRFLLRSHLLNGGISSCPNRASSVWFIERGVIMRFTSLPTQFRSPNTLVTTQRTR
jgi:type VI secretion system protein ImpC